MSIKCIYCLKEFEHSSDISRHYKSSKECYDKFKKDKKILESRPHVICAICGKRLRNISNTHMQLHNMTQQEYKEKYPNRPIFSNGLIDLQAENRNKTIYEWSPEERHEIYFERSKKTLEEIHQESISEIKRKEYFSRDEKDRKKQIIKSKINAKKAFEELKKDPIKWEEHKKQRLIRRMKTNCERYGVPFAQRLEATKEKQKNTLIKNFGTLKNAYDAISSRSIDSRLKTYGYINFCPIFSLESQNLFRNLEENLKKYNYEIFYAMKGDRKNNEFQVHIKDGTVNMRFLDFYVKDLNKSIEFNEAYHQRESQLIVDAIRKEEIEKSIGGIQFYYVSKDDWLKDPAKVINDCLTFLLPSIQ